MSIISDYKGAVDIDITTKVAAASVTPTIVGTAFKDLADILDSYLGGTLPADYDSLFKVGTRLGTIDSLLGSSGVTIDQINTAISDLSSDISSLDTNKVDKVLNKSLVSDTEISRLSTVANYVHPTTDGNKHVPANGTLNEGKALVASSTAGTYTWSVVADLLLTGYTKAVSVASILATDSIRVAIGKLEKVLDGKANLNVDGKVSADDIEKTNLTTAFDTGEVAEVTVGAEQKLVILNRDSDLMRLHKFWDSDLVCDPSFVKFQETTSVNMDDNSTRGNWIFIEEEVELIGLAFFMRTPGVYTGSGFNGVGWYTVDEVTKVATRVAISADTPDLWKAAAGTLVKVPFTSPITVSRGWHMGAMRYAGTETTAPKISGKSWSSSVMFNMNGIPTLFARTVSFEDTVSLVGVGGGDGTMYWCAGYTA